MSRKKILEKQKLNKQFKFNQKEYKISRRLMIEKVSKSIQELIQTFMNKILYDDEECTDKAHVHEDVRETSMLFKENNYGTKKWVVDIPVNGFANLMPFWSASTNFI